MTPTALWDHVRFLPEDAALWRARDPQLEWSREIYLLALIADELAIANWQRSGGQGTRPKPIPRPGAVSDVEQIRLDRFATPAAFDDWYASMTHP